MLAQSWLINCVSSANVVICCQPSAKIALVALNLNIDAEDFAKRFWAMFHPSQYISVSVSALYGWQTVVSMDAANGMIIMIVVGFCLGIAAQRLWDSCASKKAEECTTHEGLIPHVFINKSALKRLQQGHTDDPGITHLFTHCGAWRAESTALSVCGKCKHKRSILLS